MQAVIMVIESMHEKTEEAMCRLLQSLFRSFVITIDQMRNGFERVYDAMPEIAIDVPAAYRLVANIAFLNSTRGQWPYRRACVCGRSLSSES